jgi:site-specific DNA recombinase
MTPAHTTRNRSRHYRYYVCMAAQKRGWDACPSESVPAAPIEQVVVGQIQALGRDPAALGAVLAPVRMEEDARLAELESERVGLERDLVRWQGEVRKLLAAVGAGSAGGGLVSQRADLQQRVGRVEQRLARLRSEADLVRQGRLDEADAARVLAALDPAWAGLAPAEQVRLVRLLVARVDYDGAKGKVAIAFHPAGLKTLAGERAGPNDEELLA